MEIIVLDSNAVTNVQRIRYDVGTTPYWGLTRLNTGNFAITGGSTWNDHALEIDYTTQNVFIDQKLSGWANYGSRKNVGS